MLTTSLRRCSLFLALTVGLAAGSAALAQPYSMFKDALPMIQRSVLNDPTDTTGVPEGRMGAIAYDPTTQCMYFAAPRSGVLIVLDPSGMTRIQVLRDLNEPSGIAIVPDLRKLMLTGGDGSVKIFTINPAGTDAAGKPTPAGTLTLEKSIQFPGEADQIRYDPKSKKAYFGHGKFLSWINPADGTKCEKSLELPGPTKGIVIDPGSSRIFVSIASKNQILVVDRAEFKTTTTWDLKDATMPAPMALDDQNARLFVACRNPTKLLILNSNDGTEINRLDIGADAADCWWDPMGRRVYVSCGQPGGQISMLWDKPVIPANTATETVRLALIKTLLEGNVAEAEKAKLLREQTELKAKVAQIEAFAPQVGWRVEHQVDTAPGARTSVFIPEKRRYIVCAPKQGDAATGGMPTFVYIYVLPNLTDYNFPQPKSH